jgi:hypothetical protein
MKALFRIFVLSFLSVLSVSGQFLKKKQQNQNTRYGFYLKGSKQKFEKIPFEFHSNLVVMKLCVNDRDTLRLILDTGVSTTIITDPEMAQRMKLQYSREVQISGAGSEQSLKGFVSVGHKLSFKNLVANRQNLVVIERDVLHLSEYLGLKVHGIFGYDLFSSMVVSIDYDNRVIHVFPPEKYKYKSYYGPKYPIVVTRTKPYTEALQLVKNDKGLPIRLVIDTGAGHALLLNSDDKVQLPERVIRANLGRGLSGEINGHLGRVDKVRLGEVEMKNIIASFPDSLSFSMKFMDDMNTRQGSIGSEMLRRFLVTFNYNEGYIALKPNRNTMKESFEYDMSGLEVRARGDNFDSFFVYKVIENSPAFEAGLQEDDEIVFMNNINAKNLTMTEIYKLLSKREGKKVSLFVRRNGQLAFHEFKLKRFI